MARDDLNRKLLLIKCSVSDARHLSVVDVEIDVSGVPDIASHEPDLMIDYCGVPCPKQALPPRREKRNEALSEVVVEEAVHDRVGHHGGHGYQVAEGEYGQHRLAA